MAHPTPFHPRTAPLCTSFRWKAWNGYAAVCSFDGHSEREYYALRRSAGLLDVSPLRKYEVTGPDAARLLSRLFTRDIERLDLGRVTYCALVDERGKCLDDCTVARLAPEHYRVTASELWLHWFARYGRGLKAEVVDSSESLCALALQGPRSRAILHELVDFDLDRMRFFRVRRMKLAGADVWVSRTGYTGDLGFEIWIRREDALGVWDALMEAGAPHRIEPVGLDALDVARLEAGFVLQGVDYVSARHALVEGRKSTPDECGLGGTVDLERSTRFVGQEHVERERQAGSGWSFVGLELSWPALEALYDEYGLPPHLAPVACRLSVPIFTADGRKQVGQVTSSTWSPLLKRYLAVGQVHAAYGSEGTELRVEHTPEFERRHVPAVVCERPFFDPPRKRDVPAKRQTEAA